MPPAPSRRCSLNEPTTRGSSRRSRIIAMSTPLTGRPVDVAQLTDHPACVLRGRALAGGFDCQCGTAHLRERRRRRPGVCPGCSIAPSGLWPKGIGVPGAVRTHSDVPVRGPPPSGSCRRPVVGHAATGSDGSERSHYPPVIPSGKTLTPGERSPPRGVHGGGPVILLEARQWVRGHEARGRPPA